MNPHLLDATELIINLMRDKFGSQFHAIFEGDPYDIPKSLLPCLIVSKQSGTSQPGATGMQNVTETILIQAVVSKKDDFGALKDNPNADLTNRRLRILAEGRDPNTGKYLKNSICGILATNITIGGNVTNLTIATDYALTLRTADMITSEAHVTVTVYERLRVDLEGI